MKAVLISGSPQKDARISAILLKTAEALADSGVPSDTIFLQDLYIHYCTNCGACDTSGECIQRDDLNQILARLRKADIVILASPSAEGKVTGPMKDFMGRFLRLEKAGSPLVKIPAAKTGAVIAARTEPGEAGESTNEAAVRQCFEDMHIPLRHTFTVNGMHTKKGPAASPDELAQAYAFGIEIAESAGQQI